MTFLNFRKKYSSCSITFRYYRRHKKKVYAINTAAKENCVAYAFSEGCYIVEEYLESALAHTL